MKRVDVYPDDLGITDSMNVYHSFNINEINQKILEEQLLKDIHELIEESSKQ